MSPTSSARSAALIASVDCGSVGTGTASVPSPRSPVDRDPHLPCAGGHHPEVAGEQLRILGDRIADIGHRRELRAGAGERQRHDPHVPHVGGGGPDFDVGDAGDGVRRPNRHEQAIGSRLPVEEDVRAADVRLDCAAAGSDRGSDDTHDDPIGQPDATAMLTAADSCLHAASGAQADPHHQPTRRATAMSMPRQNCAGAASGRKT